jgi:hypothetical protein
VVVSFASNAVLYLSVQAFSCAGVPARSERETVVISVQSKMWIFIGLDNEGHRRRLGSKGTSEFLEKTVAAMRIAS